MLGIICNTTLAADSLPEGLILAFCMLMSQLLELTMTNALEPILHYT